MKPVLGVSLVAALWFMTATVSFADQPETDARYRVRHGGKVALSYFERKGTFERFNSRKAHRIEPNLAWVDHREPKAAQVDIAFRGERRLLLITRTVAGRCFCTVTSGSGSQIAGAGDSFRSVDTQRECIQA
jgi:hypothetical protein